MTETYKTATVQMDDFVCIGQQVKSDTPYRKIRTDQVKIQDGPTATYKTGTDLRKVTFTLNTLIQTTRLDLLERFKKLANREIEFTSIYIGNFKALATFDMSWPDGAGRSVTSEWTIQELSSFD